MITRHHIALTTLCTLIICSALVPDSPLIILVICLGAGIGTILPDIQMQKPKTLKARTLAWLVARFTRAVCTPLMCFLYWGTKGKNPDPDDKRLTHSVPGIACIWLTLAFAALLPCLVLYGSWVPELPVAFLAGVLTGLILHLIQDACTRKGITPLYPFSETMVFGSIRPCDTTDRRIAQFHYYHYSVTGIILGFQLLRSWQGFAALPICIFGVVSCLGMMIWSSEISIRTTDEREPVPAEQERIRLDPLNFTGIPDTSASGLMMGVYYFNKRVRWML
ncbi:MAG: metal-dependent hydrolase [Methanomicrobiales archaeon]|nr:metal-dependent hydrolase [Methanomicrobiales archaeon]